jgi:hypothetical protein
MELMNSDMDEKLDWFQSIRPSCQVWKWTAREGKLKESTFFGKANQHG